ncbi:MAG: SET domain-containing protein [Betaproteobacteria bacterium]|nr:MAG: SET domain-containing protein [Betaproteobacteria bacterium]
MATTNSKRRRRFVVRNSGIHGKGVFALISIPAGTRLIEYTGERLTEAQVDKRYARDDSTHTFLFSLDDGMVIDASTGGSSARWINHSCAPNCEAVDDADRIYIETLRAIRPGEELSYNYRIELEERHTPEMKRLYQCRCGARRCKGTILNVKTKKKKK